MKTGCIYMMALLANVFDFSMFATVMAMLHKCCTLLTISNLLVTLCALYLLTHSLHSSESFLKS